MSFALEVPHPANQLAKGWVLLATFVGQFALLAFTFPFLGMGSGGMLFHIDHPFHLYQVTLGRHLLKFGHLVGYDPFFGGGNLGGVTSNPSAKLPVLVSLLVPDSVSTDILYLGYVFCCALIAPLAVAWIGVIFRWTAIQTGVVALLGLLFWWIGAFRWYHTAGMASFVCASYLSIVYSASVFKSILVQEPKVRPTKIFAAGVIGGIGLWLHPLFGVLAGIILSAFLARHYSNLKWRPVLSRASAIGIVAVALNLPWILAMTGGSDILDQPYQKTTGIGFLADAILGVWGPSMGSPLNPLVVTIALVALLLVRSERRREFQVFLVAGAVFIFFAAFGAKVSMLSKLQPNRFLAPGFLIIGIAASYAIADGISWLRTGRKHVLALMALAIAFLPMAVLVRELVREVVPGSHGHYGQSPPEITQPPESVKWLESWINENTSPEGRILFETSLSRNHGGGHMAGYLALRTRREFIGGPYPFMMPERSFWDKVGFGRPLADLGSSQFSAGLELFNVKWVIAHSEELARRVAELPQARLLAQKDGLRIFGIDGPSSYFQSGDGRVLDRDFDRIDVTTKPGANLIMRYHWIEGITTTPASQIDPVSLSSEFPPFIRISNAPAHFVIHLDR